MFEQHFFNSLNAYDTVSRVLAIYLDSFHIRMWITLTVAIIVPLTIVLISLTSLIVNKLIEDVDYDDHMFLFKNFAGFLVLTIVRSFAYLSGAAIGEAAMVRAVADIYIGRRPNARNILLVAANRLVPVILTGMLVALAIISGYLFLYIPGLIAAVALFCTTPAVVIEQKDPLVALFRSYDLTRGKRWYIAIVWGVLALAQAIVGQLLHMMFHEGNVNFVVFSISGTLIRSLTLSIFYPLNSILKAVVYINLRVTNEGLTADILARDLVEVEGDGYTSSYNHVPLMEDVETTVSFSYPPQMPHFTQHSEPEVSVSDVI